ENDRRLCPFPQLPRDVRTPSVGEDEIEDHELRRTQSRRRQRFAGRCGRLDVVSGAAKIRHQRPSELRLVVDNQNAFAAQTRTSTGTSTPGRESANVAPGPAPAPTQTRPPFASAKPRAIARPSPAP